VADFCLGTYRLANLCKIHNGRLHSELPVKNKTQESVINFNIWGSCLQHPFHGMAAVCKWPVAIHANIYILSYLSKVHFSLPVYVIFWCLLPYKWND